MDPPPRRHGPSRFTIRIIASIENNNKMRAGAAASAKKASSIRSKTIAASGRNPIGLSNRVAGSSFIVVRKTSAPPESTPGKTRGRVMVRNTLRAERPRLRPASSKFFGTCNNDARVDPTA